MKILLNLLRYLPSIGNLLPGKGIYIVLFLVATSASEGHSQSSAADQKIWTLETSVEQAVRISPYMGVAEAEVKSAESSVSQSGAWPNPIVEATANNKLGIEDGQGGNDLTQMSISQTFPLGRLSNERAEAKAQLSSARQDRHYQQLKLENTAAQAFHKLQIAEAKFKLAQEQLEFADRYQIGRKGSDPLVRYLSPLEKKRLYIVRELAYQEVTNAEGEYNEAQSTFKTILQISGNSNYQVDILKPYQKENDSKKLEEQFAAHPALKALKYKLEATEASIDLEKGKRIPDLTLTFFRELDYLDNRRQNFNGVTLGITLPLWDLNSGNIAKAKVENLKVKYEQQAMEQELVTKLKQNQAHLVRLINQAESYRTKMLVPTEEVLKLTNSNFKTGGVNVLSLIDAKNTYFDARKRYLELLYESWIEAAELRLAAGTSLINNNPGSDL